MKNIQVIGIGLLVMVALFASAPLTAQNAQEWQSTSSMLETGSSYTPQVNAVGATTVSEMATTTTDTYSPASGPNRAKKDFNNPGEYGQSEESPVGDAMLPLMLCALAFGGVVVFRRRREA